MVCQQIYAVAIDGQQRLATGSGGVQPAEMLIGWHFTTANSSLYNNLVDRLAVADDTTLWLSHGLPTGPISRRAPDGTSQDAYPNLAATVALDYAQILTTHNPDPLWAVVGSEVWVGYCGINGLNGLTGRRSMVTPIPKPWSLITTNDFGRSTAVCGAWDGNT